MLPKGKVVSRQPFLGNFVSLPPCPLHPRSNLFDGLSHLQCMDEGKGYVMRYMFRWRCIWSTRAWTCKCQWWRWRFL